MTNPGRAKSLLKYEPEWILPPGETLRELLEEKGITHEDLAARISLSPEHLEKIIRGEVELIPEIATLLETPTGVSATIWNRLEKNYRNLLQPTDQPG